MTETKGDEGSTVSFAVEQERNGRFTSSRAALCDADGPPAATHLTLGNIQAVALDNLVKTEGVVARVRQLTAALRNVVHGHCEMAGKPMDPDGPRVAHPLESAVAIQGKELDALAADLESLLAIVG